MFAGTRDIRSCSAVADLHPMAVFRTTVTNFSAGTSNFPVLYILMCRLDISDFGFYDNDKKYQWRISAWRLHYGTFLTTSVNFYGVENDVTVVSLKFTSTSIDANLFGRGLILVLKALNFHTICN